MRLQIVCRGSQHEGLGHLFRTRTFAGVAQQRHAVDVVAVAESELRMTLAGLDCPVRFVGSDPEVTAAVEAFRPDMLAFDLTHLDEAVFLAVRGMAGLTVSLSPVFEHMQLVDALFTRVSRTSPLPGVQLHAGMEYAVFGHQCAPIGWASYERAVRQPALPIAVCMGGADAANKTMRVLWALLGRERPSVVWVLLGEGYAHSYDELVELARGHSRHEVILAKTSRSMWQVLGNCAVAILAGGLTTVEAVHAGLPSINVFEKREHWEMVQELFDAGVCLNGGLLSENSLSTMTAMLDQMDRDRDRLRRMRNAGRGLVDGRGSERIVAELERMASDGPDWCRRRERERAAQPC